MSWGGAAVAGGSTAGVRRQRGLCPWSSPAAAPHETQEGCEPLLHLGTGKNKHRTQLQKSAALTAPENLAFSAAQDLFPSGVYSTQQTRSAGSALKEPVAALASGRGAFYIPVP